MNNKSMVYLNKVFSDLKIGSCPLMSELTAGPADFSQQLTFFEPGDSCGCGCNKDCGDCCKCCCNCCASPTPAPQPTGNLNFVIDSTEVVLSDFDLACATCLRPCNVTVDGLAVDDLEIFNQQYMASTNDLMNRIGDCDCMEQGLSTKAFFLISGAGGWRARLSIILRGSVFSCGSCKRFKLVMTSRSGVLIDIPGCSTFATSELCLPCTTAGVAPVISFSFGAKATLLNPFITVGEGEGCNITVTGCLITEPEARVKVTRQTLFSLDAQSVNIPCDNLERCRQAPGTCENGDDDDSGAFPLRGRCCVDTGGNEDDKDDCCEEAGREENCGCGCHENTGRRAISCQFNGRNGCSF